MKDKKLLIFFDPAQYSADAQCVPLFVQIDFDPQKEKEYMLSLYPPNQCTEYFGDWLITKCGAIPAKVDVFDNDLGKLRINADE